MTKIPFEILFPPNPTQLYVGGTSQITTDLTTYTHSALDIGVAAANRIVVACIAARNTTADRTISAFTIGGITATAILNTHSAEASNISRGAMFYAAVPTGTTADVVVTFSAGELRCGCQVFSLYGMSPTTYDAQSDTTGGNPSTITLSVPNNGVVIATQSANGTPTYATGGTLTTIGPTVIEGTYQYMHAYTQHSPARIITITGVGGTTTNNLAASFQRGAF